MVIDKDGVMLYRGPFGNGCDFPVKAAIQGLLNGKDVPVCETAPSG